MTPRMGPSTQRGRSRAIWLILLVIVAATAFYFLLVREPADTTPTDQPLEPATSENLGNGQAQPDAGQ